MKIIINDSKIVSSYKEIFWVLSLFVSYKLFEKVQNYVERKLIASYFGVLSIEIIDFC